MKRAFITLDHGGTTLGTLYLELFDDVVPKTVKNFVLLLRRGRTTNRGGYRGCAFHRIIRGFMAQGGDYTRGDGTGGACALLDDEGRTAATTTTTTTRTTFDDENFIMRHDRPGVLSMANSGPDTNGSQFFITFRPAPHLDGKHVVFGRVDMVKSGRVLSELERVRTGRDDRPARPVTIADCDAIDEDRDAAAVVETRAAPVNSAFRRDRDEIDLDDGDDDDQDEDENNGRGAAKNGDNIAVPPEDTKLPPASSIRENDRRNYDAAAGEEEEVAPPPPKSKSEAMKQRLRKLKQKMNQARQLNRQAVRQEGERMGSVEAAEKERRRIAFESKKLDETAWESANAKAMETAANAGVEAKYLVEQADETIRRARTRAEKEEINRFGIDDYHNPEGQHRNYLRNLKSLPQQQRQQQQHQQQERPPSPPSTATYDPLSRETSAGATRRERDGARRLADEMHRRIEKSQKRDRKRKEKEDEDVSHINQRNRRFNEKINRTYDKHTAEIRQNLERGTAL